MNGFEVVSTGSPRTGGWLAQLTIFAVAAPVIWVLFYAIMGGAAFGAIIGVPIGLLFGAMIAVLFSPIIIGKKNTEIIKSEISKCRHYVNKVTSGNLFYSDYQAFFDENGMITPSALVYSSPHILIVDRGIMKRIASTDIISWYWEIPGYSRREVFSDQPLNPITQHEISQANAVDAAAAAMRSGFFVRIKDIKKPVWQFMCGDRAVLERWDEIFRQISTGELSELPPNMPMPAHQQQDKDYQVIPPAPAQKQWRGALD